MCDRLQAKSSITFWKCTIQVENAHASNEIPDQIITEVFELSLTIQSVEAGDTGACTV
jgi:hypothetical protein